jgi:hypothetical protein
MGHTHIGLDEDRNDQKDKKDFKDNRDYIDSKLAEAYLEIKKTAEKIEL